MLRRRFRSEEGAALVEFAIAVPVLLLIVWCMVDFSRAFYTSNSLATAVREGARYASSRKDFTSADIDSIKKRTRAAFNAMDGDPLTDAIITVTPPTPTSGQVSVEVGPALAGKYYTWRSTTPLNLFAAGQIHMTRKATFRWERDYSS